MSTRSGAQDKSEQAELLEQQIEEGVLVGDVCSDDEEEQDIGEYSPDGEIDLEDDSANDSSAATGPFQDPNFYTVIPSRTAVIWSRIPSSCLVEKPENGALVMDPDVLIARKKRFRDLAVLFVSALVIRATSVEIHKAPVTFFNCVFLQKVDQTFLVDVFCSVILDAVQYILADPNYTPEDLLQLPRISKSDTQWGHYFDLVTNTLTHLVEGWYTGSATSFGFKTSYATSGTIGRLLTYFPPATAKATLEHDQWLRGTKKEGRKPNFRKVADMRQYSQLHRVYALTVETFLMMFVGFNDSLESSSARPEDTCDWVKRLRQHMGIRVFDRVEGINRALPINQLVRPDKRYNTKRGHMPCANPTAKCYHTSETNKVWKSLGGGVFTSPEYLCAACAAYFRAHGVHRPQLMIDRQQLRSDPKHDSCAWCLEAFPATAHETKNMMRELDDVFFCKPCMQFWKENKTMLPVKGIHYPQSHVFECENINCTDMDGNLRTDRTLAITWYFETAAGHEGVLHCEECHCQQPFLSTVKIAKATIKRIRGEKESGKKDFHPVGHDDTVHKQLAGFKLYCKKNFNFEVPGKGTKETVQAIKNYIATSSADIAVNSLAPTNDSPFVSSKLKSAKRTAYDAGLGKGESSKGRRVRVATPEQDDDEFEDNTLVAPPSIGEGSTLVDDDDDEDVYISRRTRSKGKGKAKE